MSDVPRIILVTGAARSGTSLVAGIIGLCGADGGDVHRLSTPNNRRGFFENLEIREHVLKPLLREMGADPMGQRPLPDIELAHDMAAAGRGAAIRDQVLSILRRHKWDGKRPVYYKGAKLALIWPIWQAAFPDARWVIVRRQAEDIAESCLRTGFMHAYRKREGWLRWVAVHEERFAEMRAALTAREIWSQEIVAASGGGAAAALIRWLGLDWNADAVAEFVDPRLWNGGRNVVAAVR